MTSQPESLIHWLAEEVWELFQSGPVGLYEFIEFLDSDFRPASAIGLSGIEQRVVSRAALQSLLDRGGYDLRWRVWTTDYDRPASVDDITDAAWQTPAGPPYLVIVERNDVE